jgi:hypothetical protein
MNVNPIAWAASTLRLFTRIDNDGVNTTVPVTEIKELPIGVPNMDIALVAKGTGATLAQVPDGTIAGGNKRGTGATDWQKTRNNSAYVASGVDSTISGGRNNTGSGSIATIAGGNSNTASGSDSAIGGGFGNNASAQQSAICGGNGNIASSTYSFVGGGQSNTAQTNTHATVCGGSANTASGQYSFVGGGNSNTASGRSSFIGGGEVHTASGTYSAIMGGCGGDVRSIIGYHVFPACLQPISSASGSTQSALLLLGRQTTDATATVLTSNNQSAVTTNQVTLPNNSAYSFSGEVIAGVTGAGDSARWTINGAIKRGANAASTAMIGTPTVTMTHFDAGAATWVVAVTANTTLGCITVTVTGAAATTIRWVCKINTTEMTF